MVTETENASDNGTIVYDGTEFDIPVPIGSELIDHDRKFSGTVIGVRVGPDDTPRAIVHLGGDDLNYTPSFEDVRDGLESGVMQIEG